MNKYLFRALVILSVIFAHFYIFWNLSLDGKWERKKSEWIVLVVGTLGISIIVLRVPLINFPGVNELFFLFSLWFGLLYAFCMTSVVCHFFSFLQLYSQRTKIALILIISPLLFFLCFYYGNWVHVDKIELMVANLEQDVTIVHISDVHLGPLYGRSFSENICNTVNELHPDLVTITGDLFEGNTKCEYDWIEPFDHLGIPVFFVMGNHDQDTNDDVREAISMSKMIYIENNSTSYKGINFIGIDYSLRLKEVRKKLDDAKKFIDGVNILLYHAPIFEMSHLEKQNIHLMLSGHTHGGQIFPMQFMQNIYYKYLSGLYSSESNRTHIYVSEGVGATKMPLRMGTRSSIALIKLVKEQS